MSFRVATLEGSECAGRCPEVIVAEGIIERETPQAFLDFLKGSAGPRLRRVVFFNSPGGNVVASMAFGDVLRRLRAAAAVGRFGPGTPPGGPYAGLCLSACVYAMMGAVKRVVPEGSAVGLHRMSITERDGGQEAKTPAHWTRSYADAPMIAVLSRYARRMGVDPALVRSAEALAPDALRYLRRDEIRRWRFAERRF